MRKYTIALAAFCLFSSCNSGGNSSDVPKIDTVSASGINEDTVSISKAKQNNGTWKAAIKSNKNKTEKLVVTGSIPTGDPAAKVTLTKDASSSSSELVLVLSHEPKDSKEKGNKVTYKETLNKGIKYRKVTIIHNKKTLAIIGNIQHSN